MFDINVFKVSDGAMLCHSEKPWVDPSTPVKNQNSIMVHLFWGTLFLTYHRSQDHPCIY
jgi:hypothetical protein